MPKEREGFKEGELEGLLERAEEEQPLKEEGVKEEEEVFEEELIPFLEMGIEEEEEKPLEIEKEALTKEEAPKPVEAPKEELRRPWRLQLIAASILLVVIVGGGLLLVRTILSMNHLNKGIEYIKHRRFLEAEAEFRKSVRLKPFFKSGVFNRFGEAYLDIGEIGRAEEKFKMASTLDPNDIRVHHNLISLYTKKGDHTNAKRICVHIIEKINPRDIMAYISLSRLAMEEGRLKEALSYLEHGLGIDPKNLDLLYQLQKVYMALREYDKVLSIYRYMVAKIGPDVARDPDMMSRLGKIYLDKGKDCFAEELFRIALKMDPEHSEARVGLASIYFDRGLKEEAKKELHSILRKRPRYSDAHTLLGRILLDEGRLDGAETHLLKALKIEPHNPLNHYLIGNLYYAKERMDEAIASYQRAISLGFTSKELLYKSGIANYELGRYKEAVENWKRIMDEGDPILNFNIGNASLLLFDWQEAKGRYEKAISEYHKRLNRVKARGDKPELEASLYLQLGRLYNNIGVVYEKLKMGDEALRSYTTALECASWGGGEDRIAYYNINRIFEGKGLQDLKKAIHSNLSHNYPGGRDG